MNQREFAVCPTCQGRSDHPEEAYGGWGWICPRCRGQCVIAVETVIDRRERV